MSRTRQTWNTAAPETLAERGRATRPTHAAPDGAEGWYRITNTLDAGGTPVADINLYGDIGSWGITAAGFVEELKAVDAPEIHLHIASPGGEVFDGLAVYNALRSHRAKVIVQVDSLAASIASVIAMAGDRIIMSPHSQMMIHMAQGVACGEAAEMREYADFLDRQSENIAGVYAERAGGTVKQWLKAMAAETWYFADEAVDAGLADEVAQPERQTEEARAVAAAWDLKVYNYAHTSREDAPAPLIEAEPAVVQVNVDASIVGTALVEAARHTVRNQNAAAPVAEEPVAFDPAAFRAAATAALDPMPGYQPDQMRSLMAGIARDAPAPAPTRQPEPAYEPPPADTSPSVPPQQIAVDYFRSLFTAAAHDAPTTLAAAAPQSEQPAQQVVYVPEPPRPASEVTADYMRTLLANAANNLAAPEQAATPDPAPAEPVPAIDQKAFERSLREARL